MRLHWLAAAKADIQRLHDFLMIHNPAVAAQAALSILTAAEKLIAFPEIGKPLGDEAGHRDLIVPFGHLAYVLRYRLDGNQIIVIRVWHGREQRS